MIPVCSLKLTNDLISVYHAPQHSIEHDYGRGLVAGTSWGKYWVVSSLPVLAGGVGLSFCRPLCWYNSRDVKLGCWS